MKRKLFIASSLSAALAGCGAIGTKLNESDRMHAILGAGEKLDLALIGTHGLVREYAASDISREFPINSFDTPTDAAYAHMIGSAFASFRLRVSGMVDRPLALSLAQLNAMRQTVQVTRHDCVEGWSAIAQWGGVALRDIIALAAPRKGAGFVVFHTFDRDADGVPYYESLDFSQALHPQTLLALRQNGAPIAPDRGAPVRLKIPTQLGYKSAKWVRHIEVVPSLSHLFGGKGGYWEDQGYQWYAGI
ncbi:MAG TPA: molybdopterin-dependent oxidoreductase [Candidatus Rubrimentiphilum sp.]|nr:molybdopterin-dependent oxidoreductase [Candidatus Rubrimentiphilum sp.]